jgi:hypothetical protein
MYMQDYNIVLPVKGEAEEDLPVPPITAIRALGCIWILSIYWFFI